MRSPTGKPTLMFHLNDDNSYTSPVLNAPTLVGEGRANQSLYQMICTCVYAMHRRWIFAGCTYATMDRAASACRTDLHILLLLLLLQLRVQYLTRESFRSRYSRFLHMVRIMVRNVDSTTAPMQGTTWRHRKESKLGGSPYSIQLGTEVEVEKELTRVSAPPASHHSRSSRSRTIYCRL